MIQAIAIDDEPLPLEIIESYCANNDSVQLNRTFTKISEARKYLNKFPVDLVFLDIQMPQLSGIEFCKSLPQNAMVIFTTAHSQYAVDGFNLNAIDFLLKPYSAERFDMAVNKAKDYYNYLRQTAQAEEKHLFLRIDYSLVKVTLSDILYIESFGDHVTIHLSGSEPVTLRMTLASMLEKLPANGFARSHRSYIVSLEKIDKIRNKLIYIGEKQIPIGSSYESALNKLGK